MEIVMYLFIQPGLLDNVQENDKVTYDIEHGQRGMFAVNVKRQ